MSPRSSALAATAAVLLVLPAACSDEPMPGMVLGTYAVKASLQSSTCGSGLETPNPWVFDVQLSQGGSTLYWSRLDGSPLLSSALGSGGTTTLTSTLAENVDTTSDGGAGPCTMQRDDTIQITLSPGSPPGAFAGNMVYAYTVPSGYDCSDQLAIVGGMYAALPCTVTYSMTAGRQ